MDTTTLSQGGFGNNGNEGVLDTPQSSKTESLSLDALQCYFLDTQINLETSNGKIKTVVHPEKEYHFSVGYFDNYI